MTQAKNPSSTPTKPDTYYFQILPLALTNHTTHFEESLLFNVSIGRQVFQSTKPIDCNWQQGNVLQLSNLRLNFVVLNYSPQKAQEFVIRICRPQSQQGQSLAQTLIDCSSFIDHFQQSNNGAFKQHFIFGNDFTLEAQVYVERTRYGIEKLVKSVKNKKENEKQPVVLQTIAGKSSLLNAREKSLAKQNRFKRAVSPAVRKSSAQRFSRSKTPRRLNRTPKKDESSLSKVDEPQNLRKVKVQAQIQDLRPKQQNPVQIQKVQSKKVYTIVQNNQAKQEKGVDNNPNENNQDRREKLQQGIKAEQPNMNQVQEIKVLEKQQVPPAATPLTHQNQQNRQPETDKMTQSAPQAKISSKQDIFNQQNQIISISAENQSTPTQENTLLKQQQEQKQNQIQQIELAQRLAFRQENVMVTQVININDEQAPRSLQVAVQSQPTSKQNPPIQMIINSEQIQNTEESIVISAPKQEKPENEVPEIVITEPVNAYQSSQRPQATASNDKVEQINELQRQQQASQQLLYTAHFPIQVISPQKVEQTEALKQSFTPPILLQQTKATPINQNQLQPRIVLKHPQPAYQPNPEQKIEKTVNQKVETPQLKTQLNTRYLLAICIILVMIIIQNVLLQDADQTPAPAHPQKIQKPKESKVLGKKQKRGKKHK